MKKLITLVLVLILVTSLIPMSAAATDGFDPSIFETIVESDGKWFGFSEGSTGEDITEIFNAYLKEHPEYLTGTGVGTAEPEPEKKEIPVHDPNKHTYSGYGFNTKYHWLECACGQGINMEPHVDPLKAKDDTCTCGYRFSSNCDLVTLWVKGCPAIKDFDKDVTEYTLNTFTYKPIYEIKIAFRTHDSEATVELPEVLILEEGENIFEVKVTAENQKDTKTYILKINHF